MLDLSNPCSVMVALSGGVDSAVCASMLMDAGYTVHCVYFIMSDMHLAGRQAAANSAKELGLPLDVVDMRREFYRLVILPFCKAYCDGITPNPCVICNPAVKFKALIDAAQNYGCDAIATGHYARIEFHDDIAFLRKAACLQRDQSYMLYRLEQSQLRNMIFPLGTLSKAQVREYAFRHGLPSANAPDSQEICFISGINYPSFIHSLGFSGKKGCFIAPNGGSHGPHQGVEYYTIGQRRHLGVTCGKPLFVKEITEDGNVSLGFSNQTYVREITLANCKFNPLYTKIAGKTYSVKVRSAAVPARCTVVSFDGNTLVLRFETPQRSPAPGQSAVLYDRDVMVGGGVIRNCMLD